MKVFPVIQGSDQWRSVRLGIPTSSCFEKIVTPTGKLSTQARKYAFTLVAETLLNHPMDVLDGLKWLERGVELEPDAVKMYEFEQEVQTLPIGFVTNDAGTLGCSPDRLIVGIHAGLEVKCPAPHTHIAYMVDGFGTDYIPQVQGGLYIAEFEWIDRFSYHPELPPVRVRTYRDEPYIKTLAAALDAFVDMKNEMLESIRAKGFFAERAAMLGASAASLEEIA